MIVQLIVLGVVIGSNNFAAALALGALGQAYRIHRIVPVFGAVEFTVPLLGLVTGNYVAGYIAAWSHLAAPGTLCLLGAYSVHLSYRNGGGDDRMADRVTTWAGLTLLALGLSVDNFLVGFSLGLGRRNPLLVAAVISVFSMLFTAAGLHLGHEARRNWERYSKRCTGFLLIGLAVLTYFGLV